MLKFSLDHFFRSSHERKTVIISRPHDFNWKWMWSTQNLYYELPSHCLQIPCHIINFFSLCFKLQYHNKNKVEFGIVTKFSTSKYPTIIYMQSIYLYYLLHCVFHRNYKPWTFPRLLMSFINTFFWILSCFISTLKG
jgi:hypothetical protein